MNQSRGIVRPTLPILVGGVATMGLLVTLLPGCDLSLPSGENPGDEMLPQTSIVRFEATPDPVASGDTVRFTCVIMDSLDSRFEYTWFFSGAEPLMQKTQKNTVQWVAPAPGTYRPTVTVNNGTGGSPAHTGYTLTVVE